MTLAEAFHAAKTNRSSIPLRSITILLLMSRRAPSAHLRVVASLSLLVSLALVALMGPSGAAASARLHPAVGAAASSGAAEAAQVARYWTPERMRNAQPLDAPQETDPFAVASFLPVENANVPPFSFNGRIFIRQGDKEGYCSGTAINTLTRQLVLTAGHCVNSGPEGLIGGSVWSRYMEFVPAYVAQTKGFAPFGVFIAHRATIFAPREWVKWGNPDFDMGAFEVQPNNQGVNVADAVGGGANILMDQTRHQYFQTFGYPGMVHQMQECDSPYRGDDNLTYPLPGPPTLSIRCHWLPGASGGGWLIENGTAINGLTSYGHAQRNSRTFGPYFSSENIGRLVKGL